MKTRLQSKEIFIPLAGGAETGTDPRLMTSPTITTENVKFDTNGLASKRDALATLLGTNDVPASFGANCYILGRDGNVVVFGTNAYERTTGQNYIQVDSHKYSSRPKFYSKSYLSSDEYATGTAQAAHCNQSSGENVTLVTFGKTIQAIGNNSRVVIDEATPTPVTTDDAMLVGTWTNDLAYSICAYEESPPGSDIWSYAVGKWNGSSISFTYGAGVDASDGIVSAAYVCNSGIATAYSNTAFLVNAESAVVVNSAVVNAGAAYSASVASVISVGSDNCAVSYAQITNSSKDVRFGMTLFSSNVDSSSLSELSNANCSIVSNSSVAISAISTPVSVMTNSTYGYVAVGFAVANTYPHTYISNFSISGGVVTVGGFTNAISGAYVYSAIPGPDGGATFAGYRDGSRYYDANYSAADRATAQKDVIFYSTNGSYTTPVAVYEKNNFYPSRSTLSNSFVLSNDGEPGGLYTARDAVSVNVYTNSIVRPVDMGSVSMVPSSLPTVYTGSSFVPQGSVSYPEGVVATAANDASANFSNAGGAGQYYYCATYRFTDDGGNEHISAPSPSVGVSVADDTTNVTLTWVPPLLWMDAVSGQGRAVYTDIYRTSADGNDFYRIGSGYNSFVDDGTTGFTATAGLDVLLSATALYTSNGTLENVRPLPHMVAASHSGRYMYYADGMVYYSKSAVSGECIQFNDVLCFDVPSHGGDVKSLESHNEKLYIGKERAWMVTYGEPLNDAGVGQGFAPPRIISQEAGVKYPTAAAEGTVGIVFINSVDGHIYLIDNGEAIQYIGGPVRYYTETYAYDNVWFAPQDSCVRISSATVGAPTLSYDYRHNKWSTFTGRYDDGIRAAFAAPVGPSNAYVDVVMDVNGNVYVQDPTGTNATAESFNVNISTSWISLGDIAGYGKFYKWTLVGNKKGSALNLNLKTAYDYEPYWVDSQTYNASALTAFSSANQYGAMTSNTVVDQALKIQVDGSRHKTDAIRLCISENNGTARDTVDILGAKLEIGIRPGSTRLGGGRTVS